VALIVLDGEHNGVMSNLTRHGIRVARQFVLPTLDQPDAFRRGAADRIVSKIRGSDAQEVMIVADLDRYQLVSEIIGRLKQLPLPVLFMPVGPSSDMLTRPTRTIGLSPAFQLQNSPQTETQQSVKRALDVSLALIGLLLLSPLFLLTALVIKLDSSGPALFRQRRCGFNGREFLIYKFRTMTVQEDGDHIAQAERNDPRVTRVGSFLRRTSIDELPQLLNVLGGSMSLVGPRPHALAHDNEYNKLVANYALRHHVKPGLTGWAQIHGFRGRTLTPHDMENRVKLDLWYIDNWSFLIDLKILALTPVALIKSDNAF
jgi:putative colanic acid biosynthesis UDP-glucose lipid carrier transferase